MSIRRLRLISVLTVFLSPLLGSICAAAGAAPTSLGEKVLVIYEDDHSIRFPVRQTTYVLYEDGTYLRLKDVSLEYNGIPTRGLPRTLIAPDFNARYASPASNGTYTYERDTVSTGVLIFGSTTGTTRRLPLDFDQRFVANPAYPFELRELSAYRDAAVANVSLRGRVSAGQPLQAGFIIRQVQREVLVRIIGPGLGQFGISTFWAQPQHALVPQFPTRPPVSAGWSSIASGLFSFLGAFPLRAESRDGVSLYSLPPGAYSIVCDAPAGDPGGEVLIEVYLLP